VIHIQGGKGRVEMELGIVPQDMWIYLFLDARLLSGLLAGIARCFRIDRLTTTVPAIAWKQPFAGFSRQAAPVLAQFFQQFWAEHQPHLGPF